MSIWMCPKCQTLGAFNFGVCATCGGKTEFATIGGVPVKADDTMPMDMIALENPDGTRVTIDLSARDAKGKDR